MELKTVLFDLDGTLLPMDQEEFTKAYFGLLCAKLAPHGYDSKKLIDGIWAGTAAMVKNDGSCINEEAFWRVFTGIFGDKAINDKPIFDEFYRTDFQLAKENCGYTPKAAELIAKLKVMGLHLILATNSIFPAVATESRIHWAGLEPSDFEFYTTYENSSFCKPNPDYYREILERTGYLPEECLMVGNDTAEDMVAEKLGMKVFLLTDCLINKRNEDISHYPSGGFDELTAYIEELKK